MKDFLFWGLACLTCATLSILLLKVIYKGEKLTEKFSIEKFKVIIKSIIGPLLCAYIYDIAPFNSLLAFVSFGIASFIITVIVSSICKKPYKELGSFGDSFSKLSSFLLLLSLVIPSTILYVLFSVLFAGFNVPWEG